MIQAIATVIVAIIGLIGIIIQNRSHTKLKSQEELLKTVDEKIDKLKNDFSKEGITLNIKYYGEDKNFKCEGGENIGKLNKNELLNLYNTSDFGLVASLTNISLVPYEMLATGLPVIEFKEGTFEYFFPDNTAIVTTFDYNDFYNQIKENINNPNKLKEMNKNSMEYLSGLSWEKTTEEFIKILDKVKSRKGE